VIFGRNDLVQDAPISRVDLLVCRNTLMYFNAETQSRVLSRFHFALANGGILFLGKAEMLLSHTDLFTPVDLKRRLFRKVAPANPTNVVVLAEVPGPPQRSELVGLDRLRSEAFTASPVAQVVVTVDGLVAMSNRQAETMFGVSAKDVGRPFRDLDLSYRPVELRRHIEQTQVERRMTRVPDVEYTRSLGETLCLEVQINPLVDGDALLGVALIFLDVTASQRLHEELEFANRQLETAYEELQSTNDELRTINDELRDRTTELHNVNAFMEAILTSLRAGVAVVNREMHVRMWNRRAEDLWGLRPRRGDRTALPQPGHRPADRPVATHDPAAAQRRARTSGDSATRGEPARPHHRGPGRGQPTRARW
jgi:two-component system CheB/CheR fusion protein